MKKQIGIFTITSESRDRAIVVSMSPGAMIFRGIRNKADEYHEHDKQRASMRFNDLVKYAKSQKVSYLICPDEINVWYWTATNPERKLSEIREDQDGDNYFFDEEFKVHYL